MNIGATLIGQAIWFGLFIYFTMKVIWPWIRGNLDARSARIAEGLAAADRAKIELAQAAQRSDEELQVARRQAAEIIAKSEQRANAIVEEARVTARTEGERILTGAKGEIAQEMERAKASLREQVAALAVAGAEKILRREVDAKVHNDILKSLAADL